MKNEIIKAQMKVKDNLVNVMRVGDVDYISLTDLARYKNSLTPGDVIIKWMSNKSSFDFYCLWEELSNPNFKLAESREFKIDIVPTLTEKQKLYVYANEADILNVALFGMTAKEWKDNNPTLDGNMRDYANILQLVILVNLKNLNAQMIKEGLEQKERLEKLNIIAKEQYSILQNNNGIKKIEKLNNNHNTKLLD